MSPKTLAYCVALLCLLGMAPNAKAYAWFKTCNGKPTKWSSGFKMARDQCSMPDSSDARVAYDNAGWQWWQVSQRMDWNWQYNDGCRLSLGNGRNETALVTPASISGLNGLTSCKVNTCVLSQSYTECDVKLANDLSYAAEDESFWNWDNLRQGRAVTVHEFGHALGLGHSEGFNVMRAETPYPLAGGNNTEPYPDDAAGTAALYGPLLGPPVNVFVSAQKLQNGVIQATDIGVTQNVCQGQANLVIVVSLANNGVIDVSNRGFRVFIANSPQATSGTNVWTGTANLPKNQHLTTALATTVPFVSPGLYWIFWQLDAKPSDFNGTNDKTVHSQMTVNVRACP